MVNQLFQVKTEHLSVFVDRNLYGLDKDEIFNQSYNCTYPNCNGNFIQFISDSTLYTNIRMDSRIKRGLFSLTSILLNKKSDFLDRFDNYSMIRLKLNIKLASIPILPKLLFSCTSNKKNISDPK